MNTRLKQIRLSQKLSQKAFGEKIFLSQDQISLLEKGKRNLTDRSINDICREFEVNKDWLINELPLDDDVKKITQLLYDLDDEDRNAILNMIELLKRKNDI